MTARAADRAGPVRAAHVIAGLEAAHGGPSYTVPRLCEALAGVGAELSLLSVAAGPEAPCDTFERGYRDRRFPRADAHTPILRALRRSPRLSRVLRQAAADADLVHGHGLWLMPNLEAERAAARAAKPFVVSPRGMLSPAALAFSRVRKQLFWRVLQGPSVRRAACIHATSDQEYGDVRSIGLRNPVAIIANGIDLPGPPADPPEAARGERLVLSLGRIHPIKGLDRLLHAWAKLEAAHPGWRLRIAGPSEAGHAEALRGLASALGLARAEIDGPIYGDGKWDAYRAAGLFVLPSSSENFGLTVAEALAAGIPAITTRGTPWRGLVEQGCGWWIEPGVEPLVAALGTAMAMPRETLAAMGARGRAWMRRDYSWERAAAEMIDVYEWLLGRGGPPPSVRLD